MRTRSSLSLALALSFVAFAAAAQPAPPAPKAEPKAAPKAEPMAAPTPEATPEREAPPDAAPPAPPPPSAAPPAAAPPPAAPMQQPVPGFLPFGVNAPPAGATPVDQGPSEPEKPPRPKSLYLGWQALIGARTAFINNAGLDPFSDNDVVPQFSLGAARTVYTKHSLSLAAVAFWDFGIQRGDARGEATELEMHRLSLGPEARFHLAPEAYLYARPSAAAIRSIARMDETTTGTTLYARHWSFGVDAVAGGAFEFLDLSGEKGELRFFVHAEGGYGWSTSSDLRLAPDEDDSGAPQRVAALDLGSLALRGPLFRVMVSAAF